MSRRKVAEALAAEIREGASGDIHGEVVWADDLVGRLTDALNAAAAEPEKRLKKAGAALKHALEWCVNDRDNGDSYPTQEMFEARVDVLEEAVREVLA